jgi:hypothetical protein
VNARILLVATGLAAALLLAGCGKARDRDPSREELSRLMKGNLVYAKPPPLRLSRLASSDVGTRFQGVPACRLVHGADTLIIARDGAALARVDGKLRAVPQAGPVDATGAFFRAPGVTISIGGRDPRIGSGPAGVTVGGDGPDPPQKAEGVWSCVG